MFRLYAILISLLLPALVQAQEHELSSQSTDFKTQGEDRARASNVRLAASLVDGVEVWPGDTFSYNLTIGERSAKRGFKKAHVIIENQLKDDWGGGACQIASTLYAAALKAGLEIVEQHPHSLASLYIQPGLDATVAWPALDMRFRNNTLSVIRIRAVTEDVVVADTKKVTQKGRLTITLLSDRPSDKKVELAFKAYHWRKRPTWKVETPLVKTGAVVKQGGSDGMDVRRTVTITDTETGDVVKEQRSFHFVPLPRIVWVPKPTEP